MAIKTKATTIVEGSVPIMPPAFVPYRSAATVITITTMAERKNGSKN